MRTRSARVRASFAIAQVAVAVATIAASVALGGCDRSVTSGPGDSGDGRSLESTPIAELAAVQVTEYEGKDLSSIEDFRENSIKGPQVVDVGSYRLEVRGLAASPTVFTYAEVTSLPRVRKLVTLNCVEGWSADILWEGVRLTDVLDRAGVSRNASTIIFRCADGYSTSLPQSYVRERDLILADHMNGVLLPAERGFPLQLVAEDKWGYKWAKWITEIEASDDASFRGYWESRGYDNDATPPSAR